MEDIASFIENENAFQVMGQLKKLGCLTKEDMKAAREMKRPEWIQFMKEKAGIIPHKENAAT